MSSQQQRQRVLGLYKEILKLGKTWGQRQDKNLAPSFHKKVYEKQYITHTQSTQDFRKDDEEVEREGEFIVDEARRLFRSNKDLTDRDEIESKIELGQKRLILAQHYGIPYERPEHVNIYESFWKGQVNQQDANNVDQQEVEYDNESGMNVFEMAHFNSGVIDKTDIKQFLNNGKKEGYQAASDQQVTSTVTNGNPIEEEEEESNWK